MRNQWKIAVMLCVVLLVFMSGCGQTSSTNAKMVAIEDASIREAILVADPEAAIDNIYSDLENWDDARLRAARLSSAELEEVVGIEAGAVEEFYAYRSDAKQGLADVFLIKPAAGVSRDDLRVQLLSYQYKRINEFENYDLLNSFEIAQNAVVYEQGDYLIMLMLTDNDAGQDIIDLYIPQ